MESVKLGEISNLITKGTTPTSVGFKFENNGVNFIKVEAITEEGNFLNTKFAHISDECNEKLKRSKLMEGDILFSIAGAIGRVAVVRKEILPANTNQALAIIRADNKINIEFLELVLKSDYIKKQYNRKKQGVAQVNLSLKDISELKIPIIDYNEQLNVVHKLKKVQSVISIRKEQLCRLDDLVKSQFVEMFGTIYDNKNQYKIKTFKEVFKLIKDGTHSTPTYTDDHIKGIKFLSAKDITTGKINWENIKYIPIELHNELVKRVKPQKNDILLAKNGTTGICAKVENDEIFDIYVSLALLRPNDEYSVDYLVQAINNDMTKDQFDRSLKGVGVPNLHLGEIEKTKILVPPIKLQNQFAEFVKKIDHQKLQMQESLKEMKLLQESLMNKYFAI